MKTVSNFVSSEKQPFNKTVRAFIPQYAVIPFEQIKGMTYHCMLKENDTVSEGQIIGVPNENDTGDTGASIHSSIPGKVAKIVTCSLPDGKIGPAAKIRLIGSFSYLGKKQTPVKWESNGADDLCTIFAQKGVINTFIDSYALSTQIKEKRNNKTKFVVIRLFDEDPSRMTDSFIAAQFSDNVIEGVKIIAKASLADGVIFVQAKNDTTAYDELLKEFKSVPCLCVKVDTQRYPAGFMQNIVQTVKHELRGQKNSPFAAMGTESLFIDTETALSAYEAVVYGIPVVERYVHITGDCLRSAGMFKVRVGTTIESLAEQCGGFKINPAKIIINGMITGYAISSMDTPVTKQVKSIMFIPANQLSDQNFTTCVRCGKCRRICPEGIYPDLMFRHQTGGKPIGSDLIKTAQLCSGCCLCNSVCPARLPLSQTILLQKEMHHE